MVHEIENFQGVYLLYNVNPKYKGRTYIGYTVNPNRRIRQHNTGKQAGGAWRTDGKGPWEMVLIIHGFPNGISALRFEWAWQHPDASRRLRHLPKKVNRETAYQYRFRVVSNMLRLGPWCRLPLTIRWLKQDFRVDFAADLLPPIHMAITFGPVTCKKVTEQDEKNPQKSASSESDEDLCSLSQMTRIYRCSVCRVKLKSEDNTVKCIQPGCRMTSHLICLSTLFLKNSPDELIPVDGKCPTCHQTVLWGNLIRLKQGCYQDVSEGSKSEEEADHWANQI